MSKTIILNLSNVALKGDILDVGESYGVIYNLSKDIEEEIAIDYVDNKDELLQEESYDTCTMFFYLSNMWREGERINLINDVLKFVKKGGEILIWDINKDMGKVINNKIRAILPSGKVKEFEFKNLNPMSKSNCDDTKNILKEKFSITEEKIWEDVYFIKGKKI